MKKALVFITLFLFASSGLWAGNDLETLCQKLPNNTFGFVATSGMEDFGDDFQASIIGQIAADSQVRLFFDQLIASVSKSEEFNQIGAAKDYVTFAKELLRSPTVLAIAATSEHSSEEPVFFMLSRTVTDKTQLKKVFETAIHDVIDSGKIRKQEIAGNIVYVSNDPNQSDPFYVVQTKDYFLAAVNDKTYTLMSQLSSGSVNSELSGRLKEIPSSQDAFAYYIDCQKLLSLVEKESLTDPDAGIFKTVLQSLGLYEMRYALTHGGFEGKNILFQGTLKSPSSQGIWNAIGPVDPAMFHHVDPKAMQAGVIYLNPSQLYDSILNAIHQADSKAGELVRSKIAEAEAILDFNVRNDFLGNLEGSFMAYSLPAYSSPELMAGGYVLTARLKDPEKIKTCLLYLGNVIQSMSENQVQVTSQPIDSGNDVHIWAISFMAMMEIIPSWTIEKDTLIFTSHPALTKKVAGQFTSGSPDSMASDPQFAALLSSIPSDAFAIGLSDSKTEARQLMQMLQRFWPMINMAMMKEGIKLPIMLPSIDAYIEQMEPGFRYARKTADGMEWYYHGTGLEASSSGVAGGAMGLAILMPALSKTKTIAQRVVSGTNLKGIGTACMVYANDYDDKFPSTLEVLIEECDLSPETLVSPRKPDSFNGPSYILVQGLTAAAPPSVVLAYENPVFCNDGKVNVLYVDGHVAAEDKPQVKQALQKTYDYLKKPMPEMEW
jgi:prepilin-type processing-associated H-X9-DG protein